MTSWVRIAVAMAASVAGLTFAAASPAAAGADVVWLCKPGALPDPCRESLRTTVAEPDGSTRVTDEGIPAAPPIDCFYVYPTVSEQFGVNADKTKDPELTAIARYQAGRYAGQCRVFAPVYRQLTLASIYTGSPAARAAGRKIAYADVREAFREYLARDNGGRGFVLIGHSQGTGMLRQLIREEVDAVPDVRRRLVSGILLGGNVLVRRGESAGGDFRSVPACTAPAQHGCVIAFSTYDETPPSNTRFGRSPASDVTGAGLPAGPAFEALCTNPASLGANESRPLQTLLRTEPYPGIIGVGLALTYGGTPPSAPTPWLQPSERYSGRCVRANGAHVLLIAPLGSARDLTFFPTPDWGLHITDANIALGDLIDVVRAQAAAYAKDVARARRAPRLVMSLAYPRGRAGVTACTRGTVRVGVVGPDRRALRRADTRLNGRRLVRDTRAPFRSTIPRARLRRGTLAHITVVAVLRDGRTLRLTRTLRVCRS